jgi:hypothetical protein
MKGIVKMINSLRGMIAVEVDGNDFTVIEILEMSCAVEIGDVISGNLDSHAGETLMNLSKNEKMDVFIQGVNCTLKNAQDMTG